MNDKNKTTISKIDSSVSLSVTTGLEDVANYAAGKVEDVLLHQQKGLKKLLGMEREDHASEEKELQDKAETLIDSQKVSKKVLKLLAALEDLNSEAENPLTYKAEIQKTSCEMLVDSKVVRYSEVVYVAGSRHAADRVIVSVKREKPFTDTMNKLLENIKEKAAAIDLLQEDLNKNLSHLGELPRLKTRVKNAVFEKQMNGQLDDTQKLIQLAQKISNDSLEDLMLYIETE